MSIKVLWTFNGSGSAVIGSIVQLIDEEWECSECNTPILALCCFPVLEWEDVNWNTDKGKIIHARFCRECGDRRLQRAWMTFGSNYRTIFTEVLPLRNALFRHSCPVDNLCQAVHMTNIFNEAPLF